MRDQKRWVQRYSDAEIEVLARTKSVLGKCSYPGCESDRVKRGMCDKHYKRWTKIEDARAAINAPGRNVPLEAMSAIYVIGFLETSFVKIGISEDVWSRIIGMQTGCPYPMMPFCALYSGREEVTLLEWLVHKTLFDLDIPSRGEWFEVSPLDALAVIGKVADQNGIWLDPPDTLALKIARQEYDCALAVGRNESVKKLRALKSRIDDSLRVLRDA